MKLYTVVVHNLQMCMKEYRSCLKFRRGDNYARRKQFGGYIGIALSVRPFVRPSMYLVSATPPKRLIGVL